MSEQESMDKQTEQTGQTRQTGQTGQRGNRKVRRGYVVSDKMDKTVVVAVEQFEDGWEQALARQERLLRREYPARLVVWLFDCLVGWSVGRSVG